MKLMTKEIEKTMPKLDSTEDLAGADKTAVVKFFSPSGRGTWYAVEGEKMENGDWEFFGWVVSPLGSDCDEWGYFHLSELASVKGRFGLGIERDMYFTPTKMLELFDKH